MKSVQLAGLAALAALAAEASAFAPGHAPTERTPATRRSACAVHMKTRGPDHVGRRAVLALAVVWAEWGDRASFDRFRDTSLLCTSIGLLGMFGVLWKEAVLSALGIGHTTADAARAAKHVVFASMRFANGQPLPEAIELRDALKERGVHLKIVELTAGADINQEVFESIERAEAFMVFGTSNYGEKTPNPACTYFESEYARNAGKKMILLRMIPWGAQFEHLQGRIIFGMNELVLTWIEEESMPETLCDGEHD